MEDKIFNVVMSVLPALLVLVASYTLVKRFLDDRSRKDLIEMKKKSQEAILPIRLQAYERVILLLERISPESLVTRMNAVPSGKAEHFRNTLITTIKAEFEHNQAQQIYMSAKAWSLVKNAKEEIIKLVDISMRQIPEGSSATFLAKKIIDLSLQVQKLPTQVAIDFIKKEISQLY